MALKIGNRVKQTTTTTGTGTFSLIAPGTGFRSFVAEIGNANTCPYLADDGAGNWEAGIGTVASGSPDTLARTTFIASSTGAPINFSAGTKTVTNELPASLIIWAAGTGHATQTITSALALIGLLDLSNAASGQIKFPASQNASADANTLDDYEEGTWTPTLSFGGGTTGITYSVQSAVYTKIGQRVEWNFTITLSNKGSSVGNAAIGTLPFTPGGSGVAFRAYGTYSLIDLDVAGGRYSPSFLYATTSITLQEQGDNVATAILTDVDFQNTSAISAGGSYTV